jgi:hypothetical protein
MSVADQSGSMGNADEADMDTLELELTPEDMMALTRAAAPRQESAKSSIDPPARHSPIEPPAVRDLNRISVQIAVALLLAVVEAGGVWELSSVSHGQASTTAATAEVPVLASKPTPALPPAESPQRVRFTNPFDAAEVFEFPPGTSDTEAHDAVADWLLQRASDRRPLIAKLQVSRPHIRTPRAMTAQNSSRPRG